MITKNLIAKGALLLALSTLSSQLSTLHAQGTAFSVQGLLSVNGAPTNGLFDIQASIFDGSGNPVSATNTFTSVPVTNGIFSVTPDFGAGVFTGPARSLQIAFRSAGSGAYTVLSRQPVLATPYAMFAGTASNVVS